jgi:hypothetical protein
MKIGKLFKRDIGRPINGVVKADQLDPETIWQELEEFVVTKELGVHIRRFFTSYTDAISQTNDPDVAGRIGVWVSGFFGSGKSHFIKILHYLLKNQPVTVDGRTKRPFEFFESKLDDPMLLGDIKRAVASHTDVILFNIDSKASHRGGRDAILQVFLKVLNEMQGFSGDHPHIAHMERYLEGRGKLQAFKDAFTEATGSPWDAERDAYEFNRDEVIAAFMQATGQSKESSAKWIDHAEGNFSLTVESFCKWVKEYLDSKGPQHRLIFVVDEVGQFIGGDSHLMLNLQTITEELGVTCKGRAWVVVTSQEDIDSVLGEMKKAKANDFSKIQGRFKTRLSLSSANVDEVIQFRLLEKDDGAVPDLESLFAAKGDIIRNQLSFKDVGMTLKPYMDGKEFVATYPFVPYQFILMQKVFESIRKAGATGLHLSRGERSILDAFQTAAKAIRNEDVGVLVPLYRFYPAIESFLDTAVKRTIDQARERELETFDIELLKVLFLIRYVEEIKGNIDNLVTLCIDRIDADRLSLRRKIEESLARLEKETLVSRSGDSYQFLTNEERDLSKEIKHTELEGSEDSRLLGEIIFEDVLKGQRKHRYTANRMDFDFTRLCDDRPIGNKVDGGLLVSVITPLSDDYPLASDPKCTLESANENGHLLIRLSEHESIAREVRTFCQTEKYLRRPNDSVSESTKRILRSFAEENRDRRTRLMKQVAELLVASKYFVAGQSFQPKGGSPVTCLEEALEYLVKNTFTKMGLLKRLHSEPLKEIQAILRANDIGQLQLGLKAEDGNAHALEDVRRYIELCTKTSKQVVLYELIENRYAMRPYGWPQTETQLLIAQLLVLGEITLVMDGAPLPPDKAYEPLTTPNKQRKITVVQRKSSDAKALQNARNLGKLLFSEMGPDGEDALFRFLRNRLGEWQGKLTAWKSLADTGDYPGGEEIVSALTLIRPLLNDDDSFRFIERFNANKDGLVTAAEDFNDLEHFYDAQKPTWEKLRKSYGRFQVNKLELERDEKAAGSLRRMGEILAAKAPYSLVKDADGLIQTVENVNALLISNRRQKALETIDRQADAVKRELLAASSDKTLDDSCLTPLSRLRDETSKTDSIPSMAQAEQEAVRLFDSAMAEIQRWLTSRATEKPTAMPTTGTSSATDPPMPTPKVKPIQVIKAAELASSDSYLETEADIDAYLARLRDALKAAVRENKRIQIR